MCGSPLLPTSIPARYVRPPTGQRLLKCLRGRRPGGVLWPDPGLAVLVRLLASRKSPTFPVSLVKRYERMVISGEIRGPLFTTRILNHRFPFGSGSRKHPTARVFRTYVARVVQFRCVVWRVLACVAHPQLCALPFFGSNSPCPSPKGSFSVPKRSLFGP